MYVGVSYLHAIFWAVAKQPSPRFLLSTSRDCMLQTNEEQSLFCSHSRSLLLQRKRQEVRGEEKSPLLVCPPPPLLLAKIFPDLRRWCPVVFTLLLPTKFITHLITYNAGVAEVQSSMAIQDTLWPGQSDEFTYLIPPTSTRHLTSDF